MFLIYETYVSYVCKQGDPADGGGLELEREGKSRKRSTFNVRDQEWKYKNELTKSCDTCGHTVHCGTVPCGGYYGTAPHCILDIEDEMCCSAILGRRLSVTQFEVFYSIFNVFFYLSFLATGDGVLYFFHKNSKICALDCALHNNYIDGKMRI